MLGTAQTTDCCITDLTKAFDMVYRGGQFAILQRRAWPDISLSVISGFHNHMQASVRYNGSTSKAFPVTRGSHQPCLQFISQHFCFVPFHPLPVFCSTHVALRSCSIYFVSGPALRFAGCLYVNCSTPTMRPLLNTVLQMHKFCVILSQQRVLTLE